MALKRCLVLVSAFAATQLIRTCSAQSCSGTITVTREPSGCATWTGDIIIATAAQGDVALDGLEAIEGSLKAQDADELQGLTSDSLHTISDALNISEVQIISSIEFPELTRIGNLELSSLPNLQDTSLLRTLTNLSSLVIINSAMAELEGFSIETLADVNIANNNYLQSINLQPYTITGQLDVSSNGKEVKLSMPNVQTARNLSFANCSRISIPSLQESSFLWLTGNYIEEFNGAPLLRRIDGGLLFENNAELTRIALPELRNVSGQFVIRNNSKLASVDELYSLEMIVGAVELGGPLENLTFQALDEVDGYFTVDSTVDVSCDRFNSLWTEGLVRDHYNCTTASDSITSSELSRASTGGSDNSTSGNFGTPTEQQGGGLSTGARIGIGIGVGLGVGGLCGALVGLLYHRRAKARKRQGSEGDQAQFAEKDGSEVDQAAMLGDDVQKFELEQPIGEMGTGTEAHELPAKHGMMELYRSGSTKGPPGIESRYEMPADAVSLSIREKHERSDG